MQRRTCLKSLLAVSAASTVEQRAAAQPKPPAKNPIVLYVDMQVDPAKEQEMIRNYHTIFRPTAMKHQGFVDIKIVKLRTALIGKAPAGMNYRFQLTYESEELRQKWIASPDHQMAWPTIENTLVTKDYTVLLCDAI